MTARTRPWRLLIIVVAAIWMLAAQGTAALASPLATQHSLTDGTYWVDLTLEGGSGRASIETPARLVVSDGAATVTLVWSSPNYDYMIVDGVTYLPTNTQGNSTFEVPAVAFDEPFTVIGDTTAMSVPHEISYELTLHSASVKADERGTPLAPILVAACVLLVVAGMRTRAQ